MSRWWAGWRLALRLARREALRARGRSVLVLVMIALPVLGVTAADVLMRTQDVNTAESLDRRLGAAQARVVIQQGVGSVLQWVDPDQAAVTDGGRSSVPLTGREVSGMLGGARLVEQRAGQVPIVTDDGQLDVEATETDLRDPATRGLFTLTSGRWPTAPGEVVVNAATIAQGYSLGGRLDVVGRPASRDPRIVGIAEHPITRDFPEIAAPLGTLHVDTVGTTTWLVAGAPVTWDEVRALNGRGASVLSRAVVEDPPPMPPQLQEYADRSSRSVLAVAVLVAVMALIEVVLLAGPAFAVGARRQSRSLALLAATGGTPPQARRVVLASALVVGSAAALVGVAGGIGVGRLLVPVLQARSGSWFGPFEVPWRQLVGIAALGLASAVLAAAVPAWSASRQDVVAVLAGRRGDRRASLRSPILGVLLLAVAVAAAAYGARGGGSSGAAYPIAGSAILAVLGMVLLVPALLALVGRLARRLPLTLRYAARDAARHRSRTAPAVAAVAATVAGVVALGIAVSSDETQNAARYEPVLASGAGVVTAENAAARDWAAMRRVVVDDVPETTVEQVRGVWTPPDGYADVSLSRAGRPLLSSWRSSYGADLLVAGDRLPAGLLGVSSADRQRAERALAGGGLVAFSDQGEGDGPVRLRIRTQDDRGRTQGHPVRTTVPATVVAVRSEQPGPQAVLSRGLAHRLGLRVTPVGLVVSGADISATEQEAATEGLAELGVGSTFYVERGYVPASSTLIVEWILVGLGAVLMLGGTLTATFLALSDARPDLATLAAVGAEPRTRRGVASAYAVLVGVVGALLGVVVGFIPGVAVTYPLTGSDGTGGPAHVLDVPWLMVLGLVVALPLLTAAVVGLCARSRLPLTARLG